MEKKKHACISLVEIDIINEMINKIAHDMRTFLFLAMIFFLSRSNSSK